MSLWPFFYSLMVYVVVTAAANDESGAQHLHQVAEAVRNWLSLQTGNITCTLQQNILTFSHNYDGDTRVLTVVPDDEDSRAALAKFMGHQDSHLLSGLNTRNDASGALISEFSFTRRAGYSG